MVVVCISHKEDVDGIVSASMIKNLFNTITYLVDYTDLMRTLEMVARREDLERLFICDLGLSKANEKRFLRIVGTLRGRGVEVRYIDHHDLQDAIKNELISHGVDLTHTIDECTSVQIYSAFKDKLPRRFSLLAACAAMVDDMEHKPLAGKLLGMYDKQFVFFEATVLSYCIYSKQRRNDFLLSLVEELSSRMPHEIRGVLYSAGRYAQRVADNIVLIGREAKRMDKLIHVQARDISTSIVANMLLAMHEDIPVALAYKEKEGSYVLSLRGSDSCKQHLGRMVYKLSSDLGGSGGGHERACGALIPKARLAEFIENVHSSL